MYRDLIRKYRRYDPVTNTFDVDRTQTEYARMLGVSIAYLNQVLRGNRNAGREIIESLGRLFPAAQPEITALMFGEVAPVAEKEAVPA
jgi:transcriptional regulator with XRE-family HTH domain